MMKTKIGRFVLSSKCAVCGSKKSNLGIRTTLGNVPLLNILF